MPYIDSKFTMKLTEEKKEIVKRRFGQAIQKIGKPESYLMVGLNDSYDLYFAGEKLEKGAYVAVSLLGKASSEQYNDMTKEICDILLKELSIPGNHVYVSYHEIKDWGFNGSNF